MNVIQRPHWVLPRYIPTNPTKPFTFPVDLVFYKRFTRAKVDEATIKTPDENKRTNSYMSGLCKEQATAHQDLKLDAVSSEPSRVAISDGYLKGVQDKIIQVKKGRIKDVDAKGLIFEDSAHEAVDAIVFCTGYKANLAFLDKPILETLEYKEEDRFQPILLYKCTFHPDLPNMAFVGMYRGPYFAVMELQARWAMMVFSNELSPPLSATMREGIKGEKNIREQNPRPQFPHGDYLGMADSIASEMKVLPDFESIKTKDSELYQYLWQGPILPGHYRLTGSKSNPTVAREQMAEVAETIQALSQQLPTHTDAESKKDVTISWNPKAIRHAVKSIAAGVGVHKPSDAITPKSPDTVIVTAHLSNTPKL